MLWRPEPIFAGRDVAIVAGGPSLSLSQVRAIGIARAKDAIRVIAVNDAVYPCWYSDVLYACDREWWQAHDGVPGFDGRRVTLKHGDWPAWDGADWLVSTGNEGLEADPGGLRTAGNSGYQAINLAVHLGARRILLVGYDMRGGNAAHWFGQHPEACRRNMVGGFDRMARNFAGLVEPLAARGVGVVNCTPGSAITAFPKGDLMTELKAHETKPAKPVAKKAKPLPYPDRQMKAGGVRGYQTR